MKDKKEGEGGMSRSNKWSSSVRVFIEGFLSWGKFLYETIQEVHMSYLYKEPLESPTENPCFGHCPNYIFFFFPCFEV